MSSSLPCAAITVMWIRFLAVATIGTNENPYFTIFYLNPIQGCMFDLTEFANFSFHNKYSYVGCIKTLCKISNLSGTENIYNSLKP
jgi:hypothetical protein